MIASDLLCAWMAAGCITSAARIMTMSERDMVLLTKPRRPGPLWFLLLVLEDTLVILAGILVWPLLAATLLRSWWRKWRKGEKSA